LSIPSLKTSRAETTVEIPSGGALAMAGMIQEQTKHQISGMPGLMQVPVLGTLFKSRDYVNRQTELMVIVTPYIARGRIAEDLVAAGRRLRGLIPIRPRSCSAACTRSTARRTQGPDPAPGLSRQVRLHSRLTGREGQCP
jgi:type II secretory pathway component GspD/PulD (secretin)